MKSADVEKSLFLKISNLLRFENGFEIRDLHQFASKNVPHTISQILRATEIQQIKVKSADVEKSLFLKMSNLLRFENGFEIRDLHHFASKNVPHTISQILRVTEIQHIKVKSADVEKSLFLKISNLLRFENGFEIRDLHQFASKNVPHTISQILRVTEIQQIKVKSADVEKSLFLKISNLLRFENGFEIRDLHHFASKNVPHTISQILRVTEIQQIKVKSADVEKSLFLKISNLLRFENGFEIRDLHQFASKNVPHTISQILRATEIQQIKVKSADVEKSLFLKMSNLLRFENGFEIRDLHHFASKNVPHTISQILRVTEIQHIKVKSADVEKSLFLKISNLLRFENGFEIRDLHHFASKNVPHAISQILMVTEIQKNR